MTADPDERGTGLPVIRVSGVVIREDGGALLTVRKRGSGRFMLPGGKPESGETPRDTAIRECAEELGVRLLSEDLTEVGVFRAAAANEADHLVEATVFAHPSVPVDQPGAEIAELRWLDPTTATGSDLAPLLVDHVLPALRAAGS
ncbi:NUDIX domain-containing protein [Gordonia sinesedis]